MSSATCPSSTSFTVTTRCTMPPACAHRGAAATRGQARTAAPASQPPAGNHPGQPPTSAVRGWPHCYGSRTSGRDLQQSVSTPVRQGAAASRSCVCENNKTEGGCCRQDKKGEATAGVKRQHMGCAGGVENGINTVHLSYVREKTGHALIGARQWIPAEHIADPVKSLVTGLPADLVFRTKGQLAIDIMTEAFADGVELDFACGDEVYGSCTELREFLESHGQGYVLRVPSNFHLTLARGVTVTCAEAVRPLLKDTRRWEIRSAGKGSKGDRWYGWAWLATASPRHYLLVRRHITTGELAFHYCYVPEGQVLTLTRLVRAAGLRWPAEEDFEFGKDCFGLDQSQVRLDTEFYEAELHCSS